MLKFRLYTGMGKGPRFRMKRELREQARQLRQNGISVREISRTLGVSKGSVSVWVRDI
ncbi:MAG: helix-turn-helix domain-containing protein, partial [Candidatus Omnitrophica bacterium]|nr:helix-turn-helix domain-containing protein [Candidatus Omnitrophota bacterium]